MLVKCKKNYYNVEDASVAQLVEQRIRNAWVEGSSPFGSFENNGLKEAYDWKGCMLFCECLGLCNEF